MPAEQQGYDAVVIGSGLGGLAAAAVLAHRGMRVQLLEQADASGGYSHAFQRGPYSFDPAVHLTNEIEEHEVIGSLLAQLGVRDECEFLKPPCFYQAVFPDGFRLTVPTGAVGFARAHCEAFPQEAERLTELFELCARLHQEAHELPTGVGLSQLDQLAKDYPTVFEYQNATVEEVLRDRLPDDRARGVMSIPSSYFALEPARVSFLSYAQFLCVYPQSAWYVRGGFQRFPDALARAFERSGGELRLGARVTEILVENGRAVGVELEDGERIAAQAVISNASARQTMEDLVGFDRLPGGYVKRLSRMETSASAFSIFAVTEMDVASRTIAHDTFISRSWDLNEALGEGLGGELPAAIWVNIPTLVDETLAPEGEHLIVAFAYVPYDVGRPWEEHKEVLTQHLLEALDDVVPGLTAAARLLDVATPQTFERYTLNDRGATFGWAATPRQSASRRLAPWTPIQGLMLAGHWTQPGSGTLRAAVSGVTAARRVLDQAGAPDFEIPLAISSPWVAGGAG